MNKMATGSLICAMATAAFSPAASAETDPPPEYCRLQQTYAAIEHEASERFPDVSSETNWLKRKEWSMAKSDAATDDFSKVIGKPHKEWFYIAFENHWTAYCDAAASGWEIIRQVSLADVSRPCGRI